MAARPECTLRTFLSHPNLLRLHALLGTNGGNLHGFTTLNPRQRAFFSSTGFPKVFTAWCTLQKTRKLVFIPWFTQGATSLTENMIAYCIRFPVERRAVIWDCQKTALWKLLEFLTSLFLFSFKDTSSSVRMYRSVVPICRKEISISSYTYLLYDPVDTNQLLLSILPSVTLLSLRDRFIWPLPLAQRVQCNSYFAASKKEGTQV